MLLKIGKNMVRSYRSNESNECLKVVLTKTWHSVSLLCEIRQRSHFEMKSRNDRRSYLNRYSFINSQISRLISYVPPRFPYRAVPAETPFSKLVSSLLYSSWRHQGVFIIIPSYCWRPKEGALSGENNIVLLSLWSCYEQLPVN